jgi:opacity protein-like surface antigen
VLGLGAIGNYVTDDDGSAPLNNGDDVDDTSFAWKLGVGFDWFLNPNWMATFEVAWFDGDTDLPRSGVDGDAGSFVTVAGGLKFAF